MSKYNKNPQENVPYGKQDIGIFVEISKNEYVGNMTSATIEFSYDIGQLP